MDETEADRWFERGCTAFKYNRLTLAEKLFTKSLRFWPGWHESSQRRALVREHRGDMAGAIRDYLVALKDAPRCRCCWDGLADAYRKAGRIRDSI